MFVRAPLAVRIGATTPQLLTPARVRVSQAARDTDGDGQVSMAEMLAFQGAGGFIPQ